ncbi:MAG: YlqD family protein [Syntrophothermus sp.]
MITRPVAWKAVVTERLKTEMAKEIQDSLSRLDMEIQQIDFQARRILPRLEKSDSQRAFSLCQRIDAEKQKRFEAKKRLGQKLQEVGKLPLGAEIHYGTLESSVAVEIGSDLQALLSAEIVTMDGVVTEIRDAWHAQVAPE